MFADKLDAFDYFHDMKTYASFPFLQAACLI